MAQVILANATSRADAARKRVERVAKMLTDLMQEIHGGNWRFNISHEAGAELVIVAIKPGGDRPAQPKPEVA